MPRSEARIAALVLLITSVCSVIVALRIGRGVRYSIDELHWASSAAEFGATEAFTPHSGHLIALPKTLYVAVFNTIGTGYLPFRALTLCALLSAVLLLYCYGKRCVRPFVALAPCTVLLFFGSDAGHVLLGNGFTILISIALGLAALLALERRMAWSDAAASVMLCLSVLSYTVGLAFLVGATLAVLLDRDRWLRLWAVALPIVGYLAWRVWLVASDADMYRGEVEPGSLFLFPSWLYQSLSVVLASFTGLTYQLVDLDLAASGAPAGPTLAFAIMGLVYWRVVSGKTGKGFWVALSVLVALLCSQVLAWIPGLRVPNVERYGYMNAFAFALVCFELVRREECRRGSLIAVWIIAAAGVAGNLMLLKDRGAELRSTGSDLQAEVTATIIASSADQEAFGKRALAASDFLHVPSADAMAAAEARFGNFGLDRSSLEAESPEARSHLDLLLYRLYGISVAVMATDGKPSPGCDVHRAGSQGVIDISIPGSVTQLHAAAGATGIGLRRYGDAPAANLPDIRAGQRLKIAIPTDAADAPWKLSLRANEVVVCSSKRGRAQKGSVTPIKSV